jgi:predicted DCC family thiol-disulfide oxidoreductase YuxK
MKKLQSHSDGQLTLQDIHSLNSCPTLPNKKKLLTSLHLQTAGGELLVGLDANVAVWQHSRFGIWLLWLRWPVIKPIADHLYNRWAKRRYDRLYTH